MIILLWHIHAVLSGYFGEIEKCDPVNITFYIMKQKMIYISWDVDYDTLNCTFLISISTPSSDAGYCNKTFQTHTKHVKHKISIETCFPNQDIQAIKMRISYNDSSCLENARTCNSRQMYLPHLNPTGLWNAKVQ